MKIQMEKMNNREEKALKNFRSGYNCSQAVLAAYTEEMALNEKTVLTLASGFGGGMGRLQGTCGAVTGAYLVMGNICGRKYEDNIARKEAVYALVQKFSARFTELNGSTDCISLLKTEIRTAEGHDNAKKNHLFETVCEKCIKDALTIVKELTE
jgi:C_GCAxxG_C_C family probable redox protein